VTEPNINHLASQNKATSSGISHIFTKLVSSTLHRWTYRTREGMSRTTIIMIAPRLTKKIVADM